MTVLTENLETQLAALRKAVYALLAAYGPLVDAVLAARTTERQG